MLKKSVAMLFGLVLRWRFSLLRRRMLQVIVGVGIGARPAYGYVVARPHPYAYVAPAPYVAYGPGYVYPPVVYPGRVVVGLGMRDRMVTAMAGGVDTDGDGKIRS